MFFSLLIGKTKYKACKEKGEKENKWLNTLRSQRHRTKNYPPLLFTGEYCSKVAREKSQPICSKNGDDMKMQQSEP